MQKDRNYIGDRIFHLRVLSELSQEALALLSSVSKPTISRIENGSLTFSFTNLEKILAVFGVPFDSFSSSSFEFPNKGQLKNAIKKHIKQASLEVEYATLIKRKPGTAYYVDKLLKTDFLNEGREMREIVAFCKKEFQVDLKGDNIGNILKRREEKGIIMRVPIKNTTGFFYKKSKDTF